MKKRYVILGATLFGIGLLWQMVESMEDIESVLRIILILISFIVIIFGVATSDDVRITLS